jgi:hypothetical protein
MGPLSREQPRRYELRYTGTGAYDLTFTGSGSSDGPALVRIPVPTGYQFAPVDVRLMNARLWVGGREVADVNQQSSLDPIGPFSTHLAVIPMPAARGGVAPRWQFGYTIDVYSSRIDDRAAAAITWPRDWPEKVRAGLAAGPNVPSDEAIFKRAADEATNGQARFLPPYLAAKEIVRYCVLKVRVHGDDLIRQQDDQDAWLARQRRIERERGRPGGRLVTIDPYMRGALRAAEAQAGTEHDLVHICIATLRAAGIPARPVVGLAERVVEYRVRPDEPKQVVETEQIVTWGEFYLPGAGWVPFDPAELHGKVHALDVRQPWPGFGTIKDLNKRVPIGHQLRTGMYWPPVDMISRGPTPAGQQ